MKHATIIIITLTEKETAGTGWGGQCDNNIKYTDLWETPNLGSKDNFPWLIGTNIAEDFKIYWARGFEV